jgi:hypothetical protein
VEAQPLGHRCHRRANSEIQEKLGGHGFTGDISVNITFEGKVALVTGAASGLGLAIAKAFAESGASVALADRSEEAVNSAADELTARGHKAIAIACDVADDAQVEAMVARTVAAAQEGGYSADFNLPTYFLHDIPETVLRDGPSTPRPQAEAIFEEPCRFERWPTMPIRVIASANDRFFPIDFQRRVARDRLKMDQWCFREVIWSPCQIRVG